ncbi:MAG: hypothetical protein JWM68_5491 [Verrucomicrobiales bacterium]|nr:hypothetical protein [Verrucomicrobiales bacterium]
MLPIGVIIPTRNSMAYLPRHLETVREWCDGVEEVVIVDSESKDGTVEYFKAHLPQKNVQIFSRPPGLYQAWNFGISQIKSKYLYISTVGDQMTKAGLEELYAAAEKFQSDVVLSPPRLVDMQGNTVASKWPIERVIERHHIQQPCLLLPADVLWSAVTAGEDSIMGSSASNLYRAETMQRLPFSADYFRAGDMAWGIANSWKLKFAVVPKSFSTFLFHPKEEPDATGLWTKMSLLAQASVDEALQSAQLRTSSELQKLAELLRLAREHEAAKLSLQPSGRKSIRWAFNVSGWKKRAERKRIKRRMDQLNAELKDHILVGLIPEG